MEVAVSLALWLGRRAVQPGDNSAGSVTKKGYPVKHR